MRYKYEEMSQHMIVRQGQGPHHTRSGAALPHARADRQLGGEALEHQGGNAGGVQRLAEGPRLGAEAELPPDAPPLSSEQVATAIKHSGRSAPGPDGIPADIFEALTEEQLRSKKALFNRWWCGETSQKKR